MKQQGVVFVDVALAVWIEQVADVAAYETCGAEDIAHIW